MSGADRPDEAELTRQVADRAIRRLNILEHVFLMVAAGAALLAGLIVAWLLAKSVGAPFRVTWAVSALLLFLVPAGISSMRVRREEREWRERRASESHDPDPLHDRPHADSDGAT